MNSSEVIRSILEKEEIQQLELSKRMGKSRNYVSGLLASNRFSNVPNLAKALDALDYDLLARSRHDGAEFFITPKE